MSHRKLMLISKCTLDIWNSNKIIISLSAPLYPSFNATTGIFIILLKLYFSQNDINFKFGRFSKLLHINVEINVYLTHVRNKFRNHVYPTHVQNKF